MAFVPLHVHTEYSLLDGANKISEYVQQAKKLGMNAAAITDHGVMYGVIEFYKAAKAEGIKPIIGCEVYVAPRSRFDKETTGGEERYNHLILLAENDQGYHNLIKIVSKGFTEGYYYRPRVDKEVLTQYHEGLICLSACLAGELPRLIVRGETEKARQEAVWYRNTFGEGNYFLELQDHGIPEQRRVNMELVAISRELGIPLVATNDTHYTYKTDVDSHDVLLCIQTGKLLTDKDRLRYEGGQFYLKSEAEMAALFPYAKEAITNTQRIADRCHVNIEFGDYKLPHYDVPEGYESWTYLCKLCEDGLKERYPEEVLSADRLTEKQLKDRLYYELNIIRTMGFVDYFLIVWDFINYAKTHGISVGPGRGSAAGSVVSYCLKITDIDPIRYSLFFERFLNPERVSMPDIDIDFEPSRRGEVIEYVMRKYGEEKVVQIITFGTLKAKGVIRDVGRVMDISYAKCDKLAKMIPPVLDITIKGALEMNPDLKEIYDTDPETKTLLDMSMRLEGLPRQSGIHAAGVVICPAEADDFIPLSRGTDGSVTTQYEKTTVEKLGLLKMDFLGLRNLTVIRDAVRNVELTHGIKLDMAHLDYNDKKVYAYIGLGKGEGIFQLESQGMQSFMKELKPGSLEDVIAGISLYRPGPMDFIPKYLEGKNHPDRVTYTCPQLEPILSTTYGCIVYQEQVMQIVRELAGYSMGRSDTVRSAMSKKKLEIMEYERGVFIDGNEAEIAQAREQGTPEDKLPKYVAGCVKNGIPREVAEAIYDSMIEFARYAFNKSHAACYAVVAYQTAYLKYYYPAEFMAALMTSELRDLKKVAVYSQSARQMGISIIPPSVNQGDVGFTVVDGQICYALAAVKGVGQAAIRHIVEERKNGGAYKSLPDFLQRVTGTEVNRKAIEGLIKAGALDCLHATRKEMMYSYAEIMNSIQSSMKNNYAGQMSLFDLAEEEDKKDFEYQIPKGLGEYDEETRLAFEKEMLGSYVSGHPLMEYAGLWDKVITKKSTDLYLEVSEEEVGEDEMHGIHLAGAEDNERCTMGGILQQVKIIYTKKDGRPMMFGSLEDLVGQVEVVIFPKIYDQYRDILKEDGRYIMNGHVSVEEGKEGKFIVDSIIGMETVSVTFWLQFPDRQRKEVMWGQVEPILRESFGTVPVKLYYADTKEIETLPSADCVAITAGLKGKLSKLLGEKNIRASYKVK